MKPHTVANDASQLKAENSRLKAENAKLTQNLEKSKRKIAHLQKECKKKDVLTLTINKEQEQLLLNLSKDINIPSLLFD